MPQIYKIGGYIIFFWSNENKPTEPVHVHITKHNPQSNSTKIWITKKGKALLCNNNSQIPSKEATAERRLLLCPRPPTTV